MEKTQMVHTRLPVRTINTLDMIAKNESENRSTIIRRAIKLYIRKKVSYGTK